MQQRSNPWTPITHLQLEMHHMHVLQETLLSNDDLGAICTLCRSVRPVTHPLKRYEDVNAEQEGLFQLEDCSSKTDTAGQTSWISEEAATFHREPWMPMESGTVKHTGWGALTHDNGLGVLEPGAPSRKRTSPIAEASRKGYLSLQHYLSDLSSPRRPAVAVRTEWLTEGSEAKPSTRTSI